jgi:hypothetical protein
MSAAVQSLPAVTASGLVIPLHAAWRRPGVGSGVPATGTISASMPPDPRLVGFNAANFSVLRALLLRPVALPELDQAVAVDDGAPDRGVSERVWRTWQTGARSFEGLAAGRFAEASLGGRDRWSGRCARAAAA